LRNYQLFKEDSVPCSYEVVMQLLRINYVMSQQHS